MRYAPVTVLAHHSFFIEPTIYKFLCFLYYCENMVGSKKESEGKDSHFLFILFLIGPDAQRNKRIIVRTKEKDYEEKIQTLSSRFHG
jgi:hypothetical protein